jgi:hypothetical protein
MLEGRHPGIDGPILLEFHVTVDRPQEVLARNLLPGGHADPVDERGHEIDVAAGA